MPYQTLQSTTFHSLTPGPHFLVLGAIHGNETCGPIALQRIIEGFTNGGLELVAGTLTIFPICNPKAHALNQRFVERNLNRELYPKEQPQAYEDFINPIVCRVLEQADYVLDLHSFHSPGGPFIFLGGDCGEEQTFARHLGVDHFVYGWAAAYSAAHSQNDKAALGTVEYARQFGAKAATLECGHHHNADAPDIGERAVLNGLAYLNMINRPTTPPSATQTCAKMQSVVIKEKPGQFAKPWVHFDAIKKGDAIIQYDDGTQAVADDDCFLVLPKNDVPVGTECVYLGVATAFPKAD